MREHNYVEKLVFDSSSENIIVYDFGKPDDIESKQLYQIVKRVFDVCFAGICLILLLPILLVSAIMIRLESKGNVIFKQERVGKDGQTFKMYKFRSMFIDAEARKSELQHLNMMSGPVFKIKNDPRITKVGQFIRKTSIDELPQLINIIKGDMSIVGPRPPLPKEVAQYSEHQRKRLDVKPGLTCYWQVSGRNAIGFDEWVELDIKYIKERGILTDIKIILRTIPAVLKCSGAY